VRVVIDTNVLLSATFWTGKPKQLLNKVRRREITFLTSEILLSELKEVLVRQDKPFKLSENEAERILKALREIAEIVRTDSQVTICEDDSDNRVLECATDGSAERSQKMGRESFRATENASIASIESLRP